MDKSFVTIEYKTASGSKISVEVSTSVKEVLEETDCKIRSQGRQDRRRLDNDPLHLKEVIENLKHLNTVQLSHVAAIVKDMQK